MGPVAMKSTLIFIILFAATDCVCQIDLRGFVKDASTGSLIPGAIIHLEGTELRDTSDENGEFRISSGPSSLYSERSLFQLAGSGATHLRIFRFAPARKVAEYSVPASADWYEWPLPRLPAGPYLLEVRTANSVNRRRLISLGLGASIAARRPIRHDASGNPALAKARAAQMALRGSRAGFFPRRQALDTLVKDGVTVLLRRLGSFDGLWIGKTESQDTMMMAIEGDSLIYLRGPDSLATQTCTFRRIFQVPSPYFPALPSGHIASDSIVGGVPVEFPGGRYKFDMAAGFASESTAAGRMDILVDQPMDTPSSPACVVSRNTAWTAVKTRFDTGFDGSWKGINSKGDSLRFEVHKGRVNSYSVDVRFGSPPCGRNGDFGTNGFPYWVFPDGRFSFSRLDRESTDTSTFTYRLDGRFTSAKSAAGTSIFTYSKSSLHFPPCEISDSVTWMANRQP